VWYNFLLSWFCWLPDWCWQVWFGW